MMTEGTPRVPEVSNNGNQEQYQAPELMSLIKFFFEGPDGGLTQDQQDEIAARVNYFLDQIGNRLPTQEDIPQLINEIKANVLRQE